MTKRASARSPAKVAKAELISPDRAGVEDLDLQPDGAGGFLQVPQCGLGTRTPISRQARRVGGRIDEHGNTNCLGHELMQECQPFGDHFLDEKIDAGRVGARPREAGDKAKLDRVIADAEHDWDRRCRSLGRSGSGGGCRAWR